MAEPTTQRSADAEAFTAELQNQKKNKRQNIL
jgi:hypothetical protein